MGEYTVEIRRCQHIKVNGVQCASPALREKTFCYFHNQCRPKRIKVGEGEKKCSILLPAFEDANAIQFTLRQVAQMLLEEKISQKTAGLLLYTLQIASSNLREMKAEKPRAQQVVVEPDKVGETGMGQTPWWFKDDLNLDEDGLAPEARAFETIAVQWKKRWERSIDMMKWRANKDLEDMKRCLEGKPSREEMRKFLERMMEKAEWRVVSKSAGTEDRLDELMNRQDEAEEEAGVVAGQVQA